MYYTVFGVALGILGVLHLIFAVATPPKALEPFLDLAGRRLRRVLTMVPETHRTLVSRLAIGALMIVACASIMSR